MGGNSLHRSAIAATLAVGLLAAPAGASAGTGAISGSVWDENSDDPIPNVRVVAGPSGSPTTLEARTDAEGNYKIGGIDAGDYDVGFIPDEGVEYVPEWYGDQPVQLLADPVTVAEGATSSASGFLTVGSTVSGRVTDGPAAPAAKVCVAAVTFERNSGAILALGSATTDASGSYSVRRLAPAYYRLWFGPSEGAHGNCAGGARNSGYVEQWLDGKPDFFASVPIRLGTEQNRAGIDVQLTRTGAPVTPQTGTTDGAAGPGCVVPKVRGMKPFTARKVLGNARCKAGKQTRRAHTTVKRGRVIGTRPKAGKSLPAGTEVALVVSTGRARAR